MNEIIINNWDEINTKLFANSWDENLGRYRSPFAFRGLNDLNYSLTTSLIRLGGNFALLEKNLIRNFRKYASRDLVEYDSIWHWITLAQHHGLPTRLLDWTFSPYVALHFATSDREKFAKDGAIWAINYSESQKLLPELLKSKLREEDASLFTIEILAETVNSLNEFDKLKEEPYFLFFEPPSIDDRIVNQSSLFSVMSNPMGILDEFMIRNQDYAEIFYKFIIPAEIKWEIRDKLDQTNITERVLFPGLDGLCQWLTRYYSPKHS